MNPELLSAYLDDELTAAERDEVETALAESAELRRDLAALDATPSYIAPRRADVVIERTRPVPCHLGNQLRTRGIVVGHHGDVVHEVEAVV